MDDRWNDILEEKPPEKLRVLGYTLDWGHKPLIAIGWLQESRWIWEGEQFDDAPDAICWMPLPAPPKV